MPQHLRFFEILYKFATSAPKHSSLRHTLPDCPVGWVLSGNKENASHYKSNNYQNPLPDFSFTGQSGNVYLNNWAAICGSDPEGAA